MHFYVAYPSNREGLGGLDEVVIRRMKMHTFGAIRFAIDALQKFHLLLGKFELRHKYVIYRSIPSGNEELASL